MDWRIIVDEFDRSDRMQAIEETVENLLQATFATLEEAEPYVFQYYQDMKREFEDEDPDFVQIESPKDVWKHIRFNGFIHVETELDNPAIGYASFEAECDWEEEHGLNLVLREGRTVCKVGPFDGHVTNEHAIGDPRYADMIYVPLESFRLG